MTDAVSRFTGFADSYDRARPRPPAELVDVLTQWADARRPVVVDVGAGTGLSTVLWQGRASRVTAIEPSSDMRESPGSGSKRCRRRRVRDHRRDGRGDGLPAGAADIVTASQAMHWFDAPRTLAEVARILRPGGVFAAYDCDWPPHIDWEIDAAYDAFERRYARSRSNEGCGRRPTDKGVTSPDARERTLPLHDRDRLAPQGIRRRGATRRRRPQSGRRGRPDRQRSDGARDRARPPARRRHRAPGQAETVVVDLPDPPRRHRSTTVKPLASTDTRTSEPCSRSDRQAGRDRRRTAPSPSIAGYGHRHHPPRRGKTAEQRLSVVVATEYDPFDLGLHQSGVDGAAPMRGRRYSPARAQPQAT